MLIHQDTSAGGRLAVTIASGAAVSGDLYGTNGDAGRLGFRGLAVSVPSAWTSADIGLEVSTDGTNWLPVQKADGTRVIISGIATSAAALYIFPPEVWAAGAFPYVRIASLNTSSGANVNQGGDRALTIICLR
jgi:hypothetical protein